MNSFWKRFAIKQRKKAEYAKYRGLIAKDQRMTDELERKISNVMFEKIKVF